MKKDSIEILPKGGSGWGVETYLQWLYAAYEEFRKARYIYKRSFYFYNKLYWDRRFREEIARVERLAETERILRQDEELRIK